MEVEELVTKFTADISDYRKRMDDMKAQLHSLTGITDQVREATKEAFSSNSAEIQKYGKQLQALIKTQTRQAQTAFDSGKRLEDYRMKAKLLVDQLNAQKAEMHRLTEAFHSLNKQYDAQRAYLGDWDGGIEGIRKFREQITDTMHHASAASDELRQKLNTLSDLGFGDHDGNVQTLKQQLTGYTKELDRAKQELRLFDNELKEVGLNPDNLKTDTLESLKKQMMGVSKEMHRFKEASAKTNAQLKSTNGSIAAEEQRFENLKDSLNQNKAAVNSLQSRLSKLGKTSIGDKLKTGFSGLWGVLGKAGTAAGGVFKKLRAGLSGVKSSAGGASKSLLNVVKSIRRIGIASLGLKVCKSIFGELRSVITSYLNQNEQLNNRVEALKNAFANALAPALNVVVGLFEKLMPYALSVANAISDLFASIGISKSIHATTTAINGATDATKDLSKAQKDLYGFDQITKVSEDNSDGSSSGSSASAPSASSQFSKYLDEIKELWKSGDFEGIGEQIAASCNKVISKINGLDWEGIQNKVNNTMSGIARVFNGFVYEFDWKGAGEVVGNGINTITGAILSFTNTVEWDKLGGGIAESLNGLFDKISGKDLGAALVAPFRVAFETLGGFVSTFHWDDFGEKLAEMLLGAIQSIKWDKAGQTIHDLITGLCDAISAFFDTLTKDSAESKTVETALKKFIEGLQMEDVAISILNATASIASCLLVFSGSASTQLEQDFSKWVGEHIGKPIADFAFDIGSWIDEHIAKPMHDWIWGDGENSPSWLGRMFSSGLYKGMTDWIKSKFEDLSRWFSENVHQPIADDAEVHSPSKKMERLGMNIAEGLYNGIVNWFREKKEKLTQSWRDFVSDIKDIKRKITLALATKWADLKGSWNSLKGNFKNFTKEVKLKIGTKWNDLKNKWNELLGKFKGKTVEIKAKIGTVKDGIKEWLNTKFIAPVNEKIKWMGISIPKLETGGVLKKGQIGFLEGNGDEAVVPLERNTGWIEKLAMQIVQLTGGGSSNAPVNITIPVYVGGKKITTVVLEDVNDTGKKSRAIPIQT